MPYRYMCTLASFTAASDKFIQPSPFTLEATDDGGTWDTLAADTYMVGYLTGAVVQRSNDDSSAVVDWSAYRAYQDLGNTAFRATYTAVHAYAPTTYTQEAQTFADEDSELITVGPDGRVTGEYIRRLVADFILAGGGVVVIDSNGIKIASGTNPVNAVAWYDGATRVGRIASDANGQMTLSGKDTDGYIQIDFPTQTALLNGLALQRISPASITGHQNNYDPRGGTTLWMGFLRVTSNGDYNITGIIAGNDGQVLIIKNIGGNTLTFKNQSASSDAANRFHLGNGADVAVGAGAVIRLIYDTVDDRWRDW